MEIELGSQLSRNSCSNDQPLINLRHLLTAGWKEKTQGMLTLGIVDNIKVSGIFEKCKIICRSCLGRLGFLRRAVRPYERPCLLYLQDLTTVFLNKGSYAIISEMQFHLQ